MRKVTTINLNGNAYQVEEGGFESLRRYLDQAEAQLHGNPDRQEILADLERAIGDKCRSFLGAHKNVVSAAEIAQVIREMGPVESTASGSATDAAQHSAPHDGPHTSAHAAEEAPAGDAFHAHDGPAAGAAASPARRLYRIAEKKLLFGVCTGLAAYFRIDVVLVRIVFVVLTLCTGIFALVYLVMMFIVPRADSPAEVAAAHGLPYGARDVLDRAKKKNDAFRAV